MSCQRVKIYDTDFQTFTSTVEVIGSNLWWKSLMDMEANEESQDEKIKFCVRCYAAPRRSILLCNISYCRIIFTVYGSY